MIGLQLLSVIDNLAVTIFVGELCISLIFTGLIAMGLPSAIQNVFFGAFMILTEIGFRAKREYAG